jgi:septum formation protein
MRIVLASSSPRRVQLLTQLLDELGVVNAFEIEPPSVDETPRRGESPRDLALRLARAKADAVAKRHTDDEVTPLVIGADTVVDVDGESLGQPRDIDDARSMLRRLSGRSHRVHTGVSIVHGSREASDCATALVEMHPLDDVTLERYLATGEPLGKAGAYAIQGEGAMLVARHVGSLTGVIGLSLETLSRLVANLGLSWN